MGYPHDHPETMGGVWGATGQTKAAQARRLMPVHWRKGNHGEPFERRKSLRIYRFKGKLGLMYNVMYDDVYIVYISIIDWIYIKLGAQCMILSKIPVLQIIAIRNNIRFIQWSSCGWYPQLDWWLLICFNYKSLLTNHICWTELEGNHSRCLWLMLSMCQWVWVLLG